MIQPVSYLNTDNCLVTKCGDVAKYNYKNGDVFWFKGLVLHCLEGPAKTWNHGQDKQWWIYGEQINCSSQEEFERIVKLKAFL